MLPEYSFNRGRCFRSPRNLAGSVTAYIIMVKYILKLELNFGNKMIFEVQRGAKSVALLLFEDRRRPGELMKDFAYLCPQYYESEEVWDDFRNLISVLILPIKKKMSPELKDDLVYLADSMIEYKPDVNTKIQFCYDPKAIQYYRERGEQGMMPFIQYMLSLCENKETAHFDEEVFNHLTQL